MNTEAREKKPHQIVYVQMAFCSLLACMHAYRLNVQTKQLLTQYSKSYSDFFSVLHNKYKNLEKENHTAKRESEREKKNNDINGK